MNTRRPVRLVVVAGTGTEIGKTWVAVELAHELRRCGVSVSARKPAQSFLPDDPTTDADELAGATGEDTLTVCPPHRRYQIPMAPPMAADALGLAPIRLSDLLAETSSSWGPDPADVGLVELAGGPHSPVAEDGDGVDLTFALRPEGVLLVADAGLGTINAVRSAAESFGTLRDRMIVHLNRYDRSDDLHRRNRDWLRDRDGLRITVTIPDLADAVAHGAQA